METFFLPKLKDFVCSFLFYLFKSLLIHRINYIKGYFQSEHKVFNYL